MSDFWMYFEIGMLHVLDSNAYDHVLFLIALTVPYVFKDWRKVLILVSCFTIGHTLALLLSVFQVVIVKVVFVEFLIPVTILVTALYHLFTAGKTSKKNSISFVSILTLFFGTIHGLGFSFYFKSILSGTPSEKLLPLLEFAVGIEVSQIIVVLISLFVAYIAQSIFRFNKRDWTLIMAAFVIGVVLPMLMESEIWNN
jgi:hypothetical protein